MKCHMAFIHFNCFISIRYKISDHPPWLLQFLNSFIPVRRVRLGRLCWLWVGGEIHNTASVMQNSWYWYFEELLWFYTRDTGKWAKKIQATKSFVRKRGRAHSAQIALHCSSGRVACRTTCILWPTLNLLYPFYLLSVVNSSYHLQPKNEWQYKLQPY